MSEHAPTPYRYQREDTITPDGPRQVEFNVYTATGAFAHPATCDEEADAAFVVRACNSHYDLLGALKALIASHEHLCSVLCIRDQTWAIGERARAVVIAAESK